MPSDKETAAMTPQKETFCRRYVELKCVYGAATQAAAYAGYSEQHAGIIASQLMAQTCVKKFIAELKYNAAHKGNIRLDQVIAETKKLAFSTIEDVAETYTERVAVIQNKPLVNDKGELINEPVSVDVLRLRYKDFSEIPKHAIDAIQSIQETKEGIKITLADKLKALQFLQSMFKDQVPDSETKVNGDEFHIKRRAKE